MERQAGWPGAGQEARGGGGVPQLPLSFSLSLSFSLFYLQAAYKVGDIKKAQRIQERLMTDDEKRAKGLIK